MDKTEIVRHFEFFSIGTTGIGGWITDGTPDVVFRRLSELPSKPLTKVELNQLLVLGHEAPVSDGFFDYYWTRCPEKHTFDCASIEGFEPTWIDGAQTIKSINHLSWGLYRLYVDGLLYFGNVRSAFRNLRDFSLGGLQEFFEGKRFDTKAIKARGPALDMKAIGKDRRYLISEMACKSYGEGADGDLRTALVDAYKKHRADGGHSATIRELLGGKVLKKEYEPRQQEFIFSADDLLEDIVTSEEELIVKYDRVAKEFSEARNAALENTRLYLSLVSELDVYVATSMRSRQDFRDMSDACEKIFSHPKVIDLQLRYFDPTLSAAAGHEDKGLIECLMVKCAKALVYCAGDRESYGKDAEAAMALSLGKPVIFYCNQERRSRFYRDVHPLSRLIEFDTGVAVGAMVTDSLDEVSDLIARIFENKMEYRLEHPKKGYLRLRERLTDSVVRLQTSDQLLAETFWNHYNLGKDRRM